VIKKLTKQEMAEWLAEKVFEGHKGSIDEVNGWFVKLPSSIVPFKEFYTENNWLEHIYSPDGFFSVWDKCLEEGFQSIEIEVIDIDPEDVETWECRLYDHEATGKDRYAAFYNAVYEAMKENL